MENKYLLSVFLSLNQEKSSFVKELENLRECTCSTQHAWEEIINRGWIAKIPRLQATTVADDNHFCTNTSDFYSRKTSFSSHRIDRKRRRMDHEDSNALIKLVRFCPSCHPTAPMKAVKQAKILSQPKEFIDSTQANDLLSCYL